MNSTESLAQTQKLQRVVIKVTKPNFSKAKLRKALKKAGLHKKLDIEALLTTLKYKKGEWGLGMTQSVIDTINQSEQFKIENNMMSGMIGNSPI